MTRRVLLPFLLLLLAACIAPEVASRRMMPPPRANDVLYAPAPTTVEPWPPIDGPQKLRLDVDVRADGSVGWANVLDASSGNCNHCLGDVAVKNIRTWRFEPGYPRHKLVTFAFEEKPVEGGPNHVEAHLRPRLTFRVVNHYDSVARLPRDSGRIPEETCPVHQERMNIEILPVGPGGGLPMPLSPSMRAYMRASRDFPNGWDRVTGGCVPSPYSKFEVYVCTSCRKARAAWIAAHGGREPQE